MTTRPRLYAVAIGMLAATLALLPWVLQGMRLPLQNLGIDNQSEPLSLLPFSQYFAAAILAILTVGMAGAATTQQVHGRERGLVFVGAFAVQVIAVFQSIGAAFSVMGSDSRAWIYLAVMSGLLGTFLAYAAATYWLITSHSALAQLGGILLTAVVSSTWVELFSPSSPQLLTHPIYLLAEAVPFALVGLGLGWMWKRLTRVQRWITIPGTWALLILGRCILLAFTHVGGSRATFPEYVANPSAIIRDVVQYSRWQLESQPYLYGTILMALAFGLGYAIRQFRGSHG